MRRPLILMAAALVVVTNLAALTLGALNRGSTETDIVLTERELRLVNSGSVTSFAMTWMQPAPDALTGDMVTRAGFHANLPRSDPGADEYYAQQLQRRAFVALEYDGPTWAEYRERLARVPEDANMTQGQREARSAALARTIEAHTRLFVVDVDLDADRLRSRHPDRQRYIITGARVNVILGGAPRDRVPAVSVSSVEPSNVNLPRPFSLVVNELTRGIKSGDGDSASFSPRYEVHLRYGRFHEPWIVSVRAAGQAPPR